MKLDDFPSIHANFQQHVYAVGVVDAESHKVRRPSDVSLGSAFAVSSEGHSLTAFHVIEREYDARRRQYLPRAEKTMPDLNDLPIGASRQFHLAVLSIDIRGFTSIALQLNNANIHKLARLEALYLALDNPTLRVLFRRKSVLSSPRQKGRHIFPKAPT